MTSGEPLYEQRRIRGFSRRFGDCSGSTVFAALPDRRLVLTPEIRAFLGFLPDSVSSFPSTRKCALALGLQVLDLELHERLSWPVDVLFGHLPRVVCLSWCLLPSGVFAGQSDANKGSPPP